MTDEPTGVIYNLSEGIATYERFRAEFPDMCAEWKRRLVAGELSCDLCQQDICLTRPPVLVFVGSGKAGVVVGTGCSDCAKKPDVDAVKRLAAMMAKAAAGVKGH